jgi:hypothetical protein
MIIKIRVVANSSVSKVERLGEGLKVNVRAKPLYGKANEEVLEILAAHFEVPKRNIKILNGHHSKMKVVEVVE